MNHSKLVPQLSKRALCHEHRRSTRRCATVREMKGGPRVRMWTRRSESQAISQSQSAVKPVLEWAVRTFNQTVLWTNHEHVKQPSFSGFQISPGRECSWATIDGYGSSQAIRLAAGRGNGGSDLHLRRMRQLSRKLRIQTNLKSSRFSSGRVARRLPTEPRL